MRMRLVMTVVCLGACLLGCERSPYSQASPDETIQTARLMVERGEASRLPDLIWAANEDERRLFTHLGRMLGSLQKLGVAIQAKFPQEVGELKARAEEAANKGQSTSLLSQMTQSMGPQRGNRRRQGPPSDAQRSAFDDTLSSLFADPYGFLERSSERLSTVYITDNTAAVMWDKKPVLPPLGLAMKQETNGDWYIVIPTALPGISSAWPRSKEEYQVWGSLITTLDKTIIDLTADVELGRLTTLDEVSKRAGEKAFIPAAMVFYAFGQLRDAQKKEAAQSVTAPK